MEVSEGSIEWKNQREYRREGSDGSIRWKSEGFFVRGGACKGGRHVYYKFEFEFVLYPWFAM
jgi:hypothetical protein